MADHPMLFSAPMVHALRSGRKTQTRRVLSRARVFATPERKAFTLRGPDLERALQNASSFRHLDGDGWFWEADAFEWQHPHTRTAWMARIGLAVGDRLWVREAHAIFGVHGQHRSDDMRWGPWGGLPTRLSPDRTQIVYFREGFDRCRFGPWRPGIHMHRWASRLTLAVTAVRIERLQDISETDAMAEGAGQYSSATKHHRNRPYDPSLNGIYREGFSELWEGINGGGAWDANPWVIALTFAVLDRNIDAQPDEVAA